MFLINSLQTPIAFYHLQIKSSPLASLEFACFLPHITKFSISHLSYLNLAQNQAPSSFLRIFQAVLFSHSNELTNHFVKYLKTSTVPYNRSVQTTGFAFYLVFENKNCYYTCYLTIKLNLGKRNTKCSIWIEFNLSFES